MGFSEKIYLVYTSSYGTLEKNVRRRPRIKTAIVKQKSSYKKNVRRGRRTKTATLEKNNKTNYEIK